jgi:hypothetical protein
MADPIPFLRKRQPSIMDTYNPDAPPPALLPSDPGYQEPGLEAPMLSPEDMLTGGIPGKGAALLGMLAKPSRAENLATVLAALRGREGYQWLAHGNQLPQAVSAKLASYPPERLSQWAAQGLRDFPSELTNSGVSPQDLGQYLMSRKMLSPEQFP